MFRKTIGIGVWIGALLSALTLGAATVVDVRIADAAMHQSGTMILG